MQTRRALDPVNTDTFTQVEVAQERLHLHILNAYILFKIHGSEELKITLGFPLYVDTTAVQPLKRMMSPFHFVL